MSCGLNTSQWCSGAGQSLSGSVTPQCFHVPCSSPAMACACLNESYALLDSERQVMFVVGLLLVHGVLASWTYRCSAVLWFEVARLLPVLGFVTVRFSEAASFKPLSLPGEHPAQVLCAFLCTKRTILEHLLTTTVLAGQGHSLSGPAGACAVLRDEECLVAPQESFSPRSTSAPVLQFWVRSMQHMPQMLSGLIATALLCWNAPTRCSQRYVCTEMIGDRGPVHFRFSSIPLSFWLDTCSLDISCPGLFWRLPWVEKQQEHVPCEPCRDVIVYVVFNSIHAPLRLSYRLELHPNGDAVHQLPACWESLVLALLHVLQRFAG